MTADLTGQPLIDRLCAAFGQRDAELHDLRAEVELLRAERDEARSESSWWRHIAWLGGYPRDSGDRHQWESMSDYRAILADDSWTRPIRPDRPEEGQP